MKAEAELRRDVEQELASDPTIEANNIGITVNAGVVTLSGQVGTYHAKVQAEALVKRLHGVRGLANEIEVVPAEVGPTDTVLAENAVNLLKWKVGVPEDAIKVVVSQGRLTLEGKVSRAQQKIAAEETVAHLEGLKGLSNLITVEAPPAVDRAVVKQRILEALHRRAQIDAGRITVTVRDETVVLDGVIGSMAEGDEAESAAWGVPGVRNVENNLVVRA